MLLMGEIGQTKTPGTPCLIQIQTNTNPEDPTFFVVSFVGGEGVQVQVF